MCIRDRPRTESKLTETTETTRPGSTKNEAKRGKCIAEMYMLYADKNLKSLETIVNTELVKVNDWLHANKLTLNTKKSNYVIFHPYQKEINYQVQIKLLDPNTNSVACLEQQDYVKYLGILINKNLSWKYIHYVASKISRTIGIIARLRHFIPLSTLLTIYRSLVAPYLTYDVIAWDRLRSQTCLKSYSCRSVPFA